MSAPGPECIICGRVTLDLNGWDGGFPSYREFRAVWDPPRVFQDSIHFTCLRGWEHRDEMLTELVDLATGKTLEWDIELEGKSYHLTRHGLGFTERLLATDDILILQHSFDSHWLVVDFTGSWSYFSDRRLLGLIHGETVYVQGGLNLYGDEILSALPAESEVFSWTLSDLLRNFGIDDRYPGLAQSGATLRILDYASGRRFEYSVHHPLSIHPAALAYFRDRYERDGEAAFEALGIPLED